MMRVSEAATILNGRASGGDPTFLRVSTDTRALKTGDLFVALRGERFDGHTFLTQAHAAGAVAAMVDTDVGQAPLPTLIVDDTRLALGRLAAHWRSRFSLPLVALTGSSGKTTVKEMLAAILREAAAAEGGAGSVLATRGNLNNDIGVPIMLLELSSAHRYAVIEIGMNHAGEIRYLTQMTVPDVALITNAGRAHIEFLGSEEAIAQAKGEIFEGLTRDGTAVINADDRHAPMWRTLAGTRRQIEFGLNEPAAITATFRERAAETEITLTTPHGTENAVVRARGAHNVRNALAAAAAAIALDVPIQTVAAGLAQYAGVKGRLQMKEGLGGAVLVDDTYNANPESVRAAIDVLAQSSGRKLLVFGDMGELGHEAPRLHAELGTYAKNAGIDQLVTLGEHSARTAEAFGVGARHYKRIEELVSDTAPLLAPNVTVLVKGSRFMKMERVVAALESGHGAPGSGAGEAQKS
jgi:UDP-N-acetylmuramoyl-tripeptide--D-alanyl-D-alanine ligase